MIISAIISTILTAVGTLVNYFSYQSNTHLLWAIRSHGGEITVEFGIGWHAVHTYAMSMEQTDTHKLAFDPVSLIICWAVLFLICLAGKTIISRLTEKN